jgi:hypothetical protein
LGLSSKSGSKSEKTLVFKKSSYFFIAFLVKKAPFSKCEKRVFFVIFEKAKKGVKKTFLRSGPEGPFHWAAPVSLGTKVVFRFLRFWKGSKKRPQKGAKMRVPSSKK